mmetsp:Transcript_7972/g.19360  ORF Transcript_7972/g.19360 Transcript_7972/m.19360 type:complete len:87 (+) Transcript_7972:218-478(+)
MVDLCTLYEYMLKPPTSVASSSEPGAHQLDVITQALPPRIVAIDPLSVSARRPRSQPRVAMRASCGPCTRWQKRHTPQTKVELLCG